MFLITGSGRSGTSAVAKLLHHAGFSAGHDLIAADESNADGYFEERAVIKLNDCILRDTRLNERFATASRERVVAAAEAYAEEMRALAGGATPAWKDPRFSWTLEAWLPFLPERPRVIVCLRSPQEVVASTMRYYGLVDRESVRAVEHLWRSQYERLLDVIAAYALDATCVEYAALHDGDLATRERLERFIGAAIDWAGVRPELRHHEGGVPRRFAPLYRRVMSLGRETPGRRFVTRKRDVAPSASVP
jgi:hypothetical protein